MDNRMKIEISTWTILKIFIIAALLFLLYYVKDVVALFFIVLILAVTFSPIVKTWSKYLGRTLSIIVLFLIIIVSIGAVFYLIIPPLVAQTAQLANNIPAYISRMNFDSLRPYIPTIRNSLENLSSNLATIGTNIFSFTAGIIYGIFAILMIFVLTFYMLADEVNIKKYILSLFAPEHREAGLAVIHKIAAIIGSWFRGQMLLCITIFVIDFIGLSILGVPYALILALISGILEIIPTVGPIISGATAALVALTVSPWKALFVIIWYLAVQLLENVFLVPKIMQKAVGISPVIILLALFVGAKLMGIVGAILSVPLAASLSVVVFEWPTISKMFSKE